MHCVRCGLPQLTYGRLWPQGLCPSCRFTKPAKGVRYEVNGKRVVCYPWTGKFDAEDHPVIDGQPDTRPRSCGHRDCMNGRHIEEAEHAQAA